MQQFQDIIEHMMHMGGFIFLVLIAAALSICWMFRPTISRIVERFFGLPHTSDTESSAKKLKSVSTVKKSDSSHITVNVTNLTIHNPTNVQINHGSLDADDGSRQDTNRFSTDSRTPHQYSLSDLQKHHKLILGGIGVALLAWWLTGAQPKDSHDPTVESNSAQDKVAELLVQNTQINVESSITSPPSEPKDTEAVPQPNTAPQTQTTTRKHLRGRGHSDSGREEPQYVGVVGYAAVYFGDLDWRDGPHDTPWHIKTYERDKQFWHETTEGLAHKTEVVVRQQMLEHKGYDNYGGYLEVERLSDGRRFYIDVGNFITDPYWTYGDVMSAIKVGKCFATFQQKSDYYPVNIENKKVDIPDGTWVIVDGTTGTYGRGGPDNSTHQITALYWREDLQRYAGAFFNKEDLQLQY